MNEELFEKRGVTIHLFQAIRRIALDINVEEGYWTIGRVGSLLVGNHEILKDNNRWNEDGNKIIPENTLTYGRRSSLINCLQYDTIDGISHPKLGVTYDTCVSKANIFVSFAYSADFIELVDALECYLKEIENNNINATSNTYFWFDLFVNDQWVALERDFWWWSNTFKTAILDIGKTLCVLLPWNKPAPLNRAWCLYEISCSKSLSIALSTKQKESLNKTLLTDFDSVLDSLCKIDLEKATAYLQEDKERIFSVVRATEVKVDDVTEIGFHGFNMRVVQMMRNWIISTATKIALSTIISTTDDIERLNRVGLLLAKQGQYYAAKDIYEKCIENYSKILGASHQYTLGVMNNMANLLMDMNEVDTAINTHFKILSIKEETLGEMDAGTLGTCHNLGLALFTGRRLDESRVYYERALAGREKILGRSNRDTIATLHNLANLIKLQGNYDESVSLYNRALTALSASLGDDHLETIQTVLSLGNLFLIQNKLIEAEPLLSRALVVQERVLGRSHSTTISTMNSLALLYKKQNKLEMAADIYVKVIELYKVMPTINNEDILSALYMLGNVRYAQTNFTDARQLYKEALDGFTSISHPYARNATEALLLVETAEREVKERYKYDQMDEKVEDSRHEHVLTKIYGVYEGRGFVCDICQLPGREWCFHCDNCGFDVHPLCVDIKN